MIGIKQMKIMMERNEDKHIDLMKTLKKSSEEKQVTYMHLWDFYVYSGKNVNQLYVQKKQRTSLYAVTGLRENLLLPLCLTNRGKLHLLLVSKNPCFTEFTPRQLQATAEQCFVQKAQQLCTPCL